MRKEVKVALAVIGIALGSGFLWFGRQAPPERARGPLSSEVYVWQREWNTAVHEAIARSAPSFERLVVLGAEVRFKGGQRNVARVRIEPPAHDASTPSRPAAARHIQSLACGGARAPPGECRAGPDRSRRSRVSPHMVSKYRRMRPYGGQGRSFHTNPIRP